MVILKGGGLKGAAKSLKMICSSARSLGVAKDNRS